MLSREKEIDMKRTAKKLALSREALRNLSSSDLTGAVGGISVGTFCGTRCGPCDPSALCSGSSCVGTCGVGCA
jgi:hypothetical protein